MAQDELYAVVGGRGTMSVFEIYIKTTPERLREAITDPDMRARYSFGVRTESDCTPGAAYRSTTSSARARTPNCGAAGR